MPTFSLSARWRSYFFLIINTIVWGAALVIVKPSLDVTTPTRYLFYRYVFATLLSLPLLFYYWPKIKKKLKALKVILAIELVGTTLALILLYEGLKRTSSLEANFLSTTLPLFVTFGGIWLLKEREEKNEWFGTILAFLGAVLLIVLPLLEGNGQVSQLSFWGNILVLLSMMTNIVYFPMAKKYYHKLPKLFVSTISFYVGLVTFAVMSLLESAHYQLGSISFNFISEINHLQNLILSDFNHPSVWIATLYMAVFGSIIGLTAYIKGQDGIEASEASLFYYLQPLVYIPMAYFFLGETVSAMQFLALTIIFGGVVLAEKRFKKSKTKRRKII